MAQPTHPLFPKDCRSARVTATFASASDTKSSVVDTSLWRCGVMYLPAEFNTDTITFEGSNAEDGTFALILTEAAGTTVGFTAAAGARWYRLHQAVMDCPFIKVVTGTGVAAPATIEFGFKT